MTSFATTMAGSRIVRFGLPIVSLVVLLLATDRDPQRQIASAEDVAHAEALVATWRAQMCAMRCPRPALREPVTAGDGSPLLLGVRGTSNPERWRDDSIDAQCLYAVGSAQPLAKSPMPVLAPPDVAQLCAPLFDEIERLAHTAEACSPNRSDGTLMDLTPIIHLPKAVRIEVTPLVVSGKLGVAARRITDAMRFVDDFGRGTYLVGPMVGVALHEQLADVLDELLADPRLTAEEARAIARDLDVLRTTGPSFADTMRAEMMTMALYIWFGHSGIASEDERVILVLDAERRYASWRDRCENVPLKTCAERLATFETGMNDYARVFARRDFVLASLRMQAELRMLPPAICRDVDRRRAALAPFLGDTRLVDLTLVPPDWQHGRYRRAAPRTLRCGSP